MVDDILDAEASTATLGKTAGKDAACDKPTFVSLMGLEGARALAQHLLQQAHDQLARAPLAQPAPLHALADWVVLRGH